eukprot:3657431-Alexandrium_andersonii.AAC.1
MSGGTRAVVACRQVAPDSSVPEFKTHGPPWVQVASCASPLRIRIALGQATSMSFSISGVHG